METLGKNITDAMGNITGTKKESNMDPISQQDNTVTLTGLALDVANTKTLFKKKLTEISDAINQDADKINSYVRDLKLIIGNNNSAKKQIEELKTLMDEFNKVGSYSDSKDKMDTAMTALDNSINSKETVDTNRSLNPNAKPFVPKKPDQAGGYLSTPHRRKRNMKSNSTRNFFKFTSKRGVKKANKKSRKKRKN